MKTKMTLIGILGAFLFQACTTIPGLPTTGTAAKFNLATTEWVLNQNAAIEERISQILIDSLQVILDQALASDRQQLALMDSTLQAMEETLNQTSALMEGRTDTLKAQIINLQNATAQLKVSVTQIQRTAADLPREALKELSKAVSKYLEEKTASTPETKSE